MSYVKKAVAAVAAVMLVGSPVAAQPSLSIAKSTAAKVKRVGVSSKDENSLGSKSTILALLAAAAVVIGIILISGDDSPSSP